MKQILIELWDVASNLLRLVGIGVLTVAFMVPSIIDADLVFRFTKASLIPVAIIVILRAATFRKKSSS